MNGRSPELAALETEADALEREVDAMAPDAPSNPKARRRLTDRVADLCARATALPPAEAHAIAGRLSQLISALDRAAKRLRPDAPPDDSQSTRARARQATAAYGAAANRRRRGF